MTAQTADQRAQQITEATSRAQSNAAKPELWLTNRPTAAS